MRWVSCILAGGCWLTAPLLAAEPTKQQLLVAIEQQLQATHEKVGPSVVCVVVSRSDRYPQRPDRELRPGQLGSFDVHEFLKTHPHEKRLAESLDLSDPRSIADHSSACGVIIDSTGIILVPYHVVEGATKIYVHLSGGKGSYADIHAADARHDLATLKLINPPAPLKAISWADVRLNRRPEQKPTLFPGKLAIQVAHAYVSGFAIDKPSVALGSITNILEQPLESKERGRKLESYYYFGPLLQHDAKLTLGADGAALVNLDGEMIGLTTSAAAISGERAALYAFPADECFRRVVEVLRRGEEVEYGALGVSLATDTTSVEVGMVTPHSAADLAGLRSGDVITHINGIPVRHYNDLLLHIGSALAGSEVTLTVVQGFRSRQIPVLLGKLPHGQPTLASVRPPSVFGLRVDFGPTMLGLSVRELVENSPAAAAFKKLTDRPETLLITRVNGQPVRTPREFYSAAKGQQTLKLTVIDNEDPKRREREVTLP
ncbi:MAG: PDZ domain-containing protein [Gemmata sp.]|nr:PDZ domain-containing protein [Gemmata sp.]